MDVQENLSYYEYTCSETDYTEATSSLSSTYSDDWDDRYIKVDKWVEHFEEVTDNINKIGDEIDECKRSLSQTENEIKEANSKLEELKSRRLYKELMLSYNYKSYGILTKRKNQLLESSIELNSRFQVVGQEVEDEARTEILNQLKDLVEKRDKVAKKIVRVIQELNKGAESLRPIFEETEEVQLRLKELFLYESYLVETMELNKAVMDVLCKRLEYLLVIVD